MEIDYSEDLGLEKIEKTNEIIESEILPNVKKSYEETDISQGTESAFIWVSHSPYSSINITSPMEKLSNIFWKGINNQ